MKTGPNRPRVVIVGAGFGGMQAAQSLAGSDADVTLIDRNNYNTFVPLLYQVAAAQVEPETVAYPLRTILRHRTGLRFLQADVTGVDLERQTVETDGPVVPYDYLILATGSRTQFLGIPGAMENAFPLRTLAQAVALRNQIFYCFERAAQTPDPERRQELLTFAIVGGGPTGVEMAGALAELKQALRRDYANLDVSTVRIVLVHSGDRLLPGWPARSGRYAARKLQRLGVEIQLQARVDRVAAETLGFQDGSSLGARTTVWAAGLEAASPEMSSPPKIASKGKLQVWPTLQLAGESNVYAIGDLAHARLHGKPPTGVAPEALQQGVTAARNVRRQLEGKAPKPFSYLNKGHLAIIGGYGAVGKIGPVLLTGILPWLMWLGVHWVYLPGFRNRLLALLAWIHAYGLGDRAIRIALLSTSLSFTSSPARDTRDGLPLKARE